MIKSDYMKGISNWMIMIIGSFIISAIVVYSASSTTTETFTDKGPITELSGLGIRNTINLVSATELGWRQYETTEEFEIIITSDFVEIKNPTTGDTTKLPHSLTDLNTAGPLRGSTFCIVKKLNTDCEPIVEVCLPQGNPNCCNIDPNGCL